MESHECVWFSVVLPSAAETESERANGGRLITRSATAANVIIGLFRPDIHIIRRVANRRARKPRRRANNLHDVCSTRAACVSLWPTLFATDSRHIMTTTSNQKRFAPHCLLLFELIEYFLYYIIPKSSSYGRSHF
jgi:hypothetical protein